MAVYNKIYSGSFEDILGDQIDIYIKQKDFSGNPSTLLLDSNPLVISYPKKEFWESLFGCGCEINIINQSNNFFFYDSLFSVPEKSNYIEIVKTSNNLDSSILLFQGYILPDMYTSTIEKNIKLSVPATDQLTVLENSIPNAVIDTSTERIDEYENAFGIISNILSQADITNKIAIHNTLENINYKTTDSSTTVFDDIYFQTDNFYDKTTVQNSNACLAKIFKPFYSRCFYFDGKWNIERVSDLGKDNKSYILYEKDVSSLRVDVSNNKIDISCPKHRIISKTPALTFNPGYQKIILTLNYKEPDSLVENYYWNIDYLDVSTMSNGGKPRPSFRRWMMSGTDASLSQKVYNSTKLTNGMWMFVDIWSTMAIRYMWFKDQFASTMFQFSPDPLKTEIEISYKHELTPVMVYGLTTGDIANIYVIQRFALRACDANGKDWWIAKSISTDSSSYWSSTPYAFTTTKSWADIVEANYLWEIKDTVNITDPILIDVSICQGSKRYGGWNWDNWQWERRGIIATTYTVPSNPQKIGQLYLDVYPLLRNAPDVYTELIGLTPGTFFPYYTWFGDVDVDIKTPKPYNILESSIGNWNTIKEMDIDIFDTSTIMFTNGIYNIDASYNYRAIGGWRDKSTDNYIKLQNKYIEDLAQMYHKPRYSLDVDIKSNDSSVWTLSNLYTHEMIKYPDGSTLEFMCNGLQYNVKENTYRLNLLEYIDDDNWRNDPVVPPGPPPSFFSILAPGSFSPNWQGEDNFNYIDVCTNVLYSFDTDETWITMAGSVPGPNDVSVWFDENYGIARDGSITFTASGLGTYVLSVHQDSSEAGLNITFDDYGNITLLNLDVYAVDISIWVRAAATAQSYSDQSFTTDSEAWYNLNGSRPDAPDRAHVYVTAPPEISDISTMYYNIIGVDKTDTMFVDWAYGEYKDDEEATLVPSMSAKITKCTKTGDAGDVSILYNYFWNSYLNTGIMSTP